jgi:hypothetical protein
MGHYLLSAKMTILLRNIIQEIMGRGAGGVSDKEILMLKVRG